MSLAISRLDLPQVALACLARLEQVQKFSESICSKSIFRGLHDNVSEMLDIIGDCLRTELTVTYLLSNVT